jgi:ribonuclease P protein component
MIPSKFRLNLAKNFRRVKKYAKAITTPYFTLLVNDRRNLIRDLPEGPKVGFVVSAKVGKATARNRAKRLLSEAVQPKIEGLPKSLELVFIARPLVVEASSEQVKEAFDKALVKIKETGK